MVEKVLIYYLFLDINTINMNCVLYLPYSIGDPENGFKYNGGEELTDRKYVRLVVDDYNQYKDSVSSIVGSMYYGSGNRFMSGLAKSNPLKTNFMEKYGKRGYTRQDYEYYKFECDLYDMDGGEETIDRLLGYYRHGEQFVIIIKAKGISENPDLETELKMWATESDHINRSGRLSEEEKLCNLPKKDMKIVFPKSNSSAILNECKLIKAYDSLSYAVLVKRILFVKE